MIYAYDKGVQLPITDLYDTQMRLAYISAAKDMYEKAAQEMKDFKKEYGDFYSSRPGDMQWYALEYNKVKSQIDDLYAQGIDPLRSPEGRILVRLARDSFDDAQFAARKKSAAVYDEYMKNKAALEKLGLYNDEYEKWRLAREGKSLDDVQFDLYSPGAYLDEDALTDDIFKGLKPELIRTDPVTGMDYKGVTMDRRRIALDAKIDTILGTQSGKFIEDKVRQQLGPDASEQDVRKAVEDRILAATTRHDYEMPEENPDYKRQKEYEKQIGLLNHQHNLGERAKDAALLRSIALVKAKNAGKPGYDAEGNPIGNGDTNELTGYVGRRQYAAMDNNLDNIIQNVHLDILKGKKYSNEEVTHISREYYDKSSVKPGGPDLMATLAFVSDMQTPEEVAMGMQQKRIPISFDADDIYARNNISFRAFNNEYESLYGKRWNRKNEIDVIKHLRKNHVEGYIPNNNATVNYFNEGGVDYLAINFTARINKDDFDKENDYMRYNGTTKQSYDQILNSSGIKVVTKQQKVVDPENKSSSNNTMWSDVNYVDIPVTKLVPLYGTKAAELNTWADRISGGTSAAKQNQQEYILEILSELMEQ